MTQDGVMPPPPQHPLATKIKLDETWSDWKKDWDTEQRYSRKLGLLHSGWSTTWKTKEEIVEKVLFYLSLADGYADPTAILLPEEHGAYGYEQSKRYIEARRELSRKAFQVLCEKLFKDKGDDCPMPSWLMSHLQDEQIMCKVVWFLRAERGTWGGWASLYNLRGDRDDYRHKILREFAFTLTRIAFQFQTDRFGYSALREMRMSSTTKEKLRDLFASHEPDMVKILAGLGALHLLLDAEKYPLSPAGLETLKEIALTERFYFPGEKMDDGPRLAKTLEEASLGGSKAAQVYLLLQINERERKRLLAIAREKDQIEESERKLKEMGVRTSA